jgi:protein ImuB
MFGCIFLPRFRLQASLRWHDVCGPAVVVDEATLKGVVSEVSEEAAANGITAGMTSAQAMARERNLIIRPRSPAQEECLNQILVQTALALSPDAELCCDGACVADLRHVRKETCWQQLADQQVAQLGKHGLCAVMGIAPTPDLAFLAARGAQPSAVVYDAGAFASRLPIETLEPPEDLLQILHGWGIHHVGEFLALPKTEIIERLGPAAEVLRRKVSGRNKRLLRLIRPAPEYTEAFDFDCEIETVEPLLFLLRRFLDGLCGRLRAVYRVAQRLVLCLPLEDGSCHERAFCIPMPTADVDVLFRILNTHLENLQLAKRPIGVRLSIQAALPAKDQLRLFESALRDPNRFGETLAKLKAFLGNDNVGVPARNNSHRPDSYVLGDCFAVETETGKESASVSELPRGLPLQRFRPAIPSSVRVKNGSPAIVESPAVCGTIRNCAGPYRLSGNWWDSERWQQEEWDVALTKGGLYRLSRHGTIWKIEGCYEGMCAAP